jgi:peptidoglycan/LPS O-acetylase OafA/YrhL
VLTHLTLTHQLFPGTFYGLNGAYWSLGLEWELYLTLPLIIVAVRRFGAGRTVAALVVANAVYRVGLAIAIAHGLAAKDGAMATAVLPNLFIGRWGEFALGVLAAELYATGRAAAWGHRLQWVALAVVPVAFVANDNPLSHLLFGLVFFTAVCMVAGACRPAVSIASWTPLVVIGVMSYSLYLVHQPLVEMGGALLGAGRGVPPSTVFVELLILSPLLLVAAWLLFMAVERRTVDRASMDTLLRYRFLVPRRRVPAAPLTLAEGTGS